MQVYHVPWHTPGTVLLANVNRRWRERGLTLMIFRGDKRVPSGYKMIQQAWPFFLILENAFLTLHQYHPGLPSWPVNPTHSIRAASLVQSLETRIIPIAYLVSGQVLLT